MLILQHFNFKIKRTIIIIIIIIGNFNKVFYLGIQYKLKVYKESIYTIIK